MNLLEFNPQKHRNKVYLCGFLANRLHNEQIYTIARELMVTFFVCTNPTTLNKWNKKETTTLLTQCDVMVFWLNRYTLNDRNCLTALQIALENNVPVVMVRHPRMRLVVNPILSQRIRGKPESDDSEPSAANMTFLQYAILEGYKQSLEYDRSNHEVSLQRLTNKILETKYAANSGTVSPQNSDSTTDNCQEAMDMLRLPPVPGAYSFNSVDARRMSTISYILARSRSFDSVNVAHVSLPVPPTTMRTISQEPKKPSKLPIVTRRNGSLPRVITLQKSKTMTEEDFLKASNSSLKVPKNNFLASSPDLRNESREAALRSTNDPALYQSTQYLVFPLSKRSTKPRLIHFPQDIITKGQDVEVESLWGSTDSSLADEADRAPIVQGDLDICSPPPTPAPYIDPL